jgi:hypothetical protein
MRAVVRAEAKFKYADHNPVEHRQRVIANLEDRDHGLDTGAATQQRRRRRRLVTGRRSADPHDHHVADGGAAAMDWCGGGDAVGAN